MIVLQLVIYYFFFLMIRRPPRSTLDRSSAASDVYKRQAFMFQYVLIPLAILALVNLGGCPTETTPPVAPVTVSYTHLRAHETVLDLVFRLLLEKKTTPVTKYKIS